MLAGLVILYAAGTCYGKVFRACEHQGQKNLNCPAGQQIAVSSAFYGRRSKTVCGSNNNINCVAGNSQQKLKSLCNGKQSCAINPSNTVFGDPCRGVVKYVEVTYECKAGSMQSPSSDGIELDKKKLIEFVKAYKLPEYSKGGSTSYRVNNVRLSSFDMDSISVVPGSNSITVSVKNVHGRVEGSYRARIKKWFLSASSSGRIRANFSGASITAVASVSSAGKIQVQRCEDRIGSLKVRTSGSAWSWLINFIVGFFDNKIKNKVESIMCPSLIKLVNAQSDNIMKQLGNL